MMKINVEEEEEAADLFSAEQPRSMIQDRLADL